MKKVIVTARSFGKSDDSAYKLLEENGFEVKKLVAEENGESLETQLEWEIVDADAVIAGLEPYSASLIRTAKQLKVISRYGVGYDAVDCKAAAELGIPVTITPGVNSDSVADLAVTLMLSTARNISYMDKTQKAGRFMRPQGLEMWQKTLGVIGAGRIGKGVAKRCKGFDMQVLLYDQYQDNAFAESIGAVYTDLDTILAKADFITIHSPLTDETKGMIGAEAFKKMKKTAIIVNTARGGIIDEEALYTALKTGEIYGAALDVTVSEPVCESPLSKLDNCILTPHAGAATVESSNRMSYMAAQNVIEVMNTGTSVNRVN